MSQHEALSLDDLVAAVEALGPMPRPIRVVVSKYAPAFLCAEIPSLDLGSPRTFVIGAEAWREFRRNVETVTSAPGASFLGVPVEFSPRGWAP